MGEMYKKDADLERRKNTKNNRNFRERRTGKNLGIQSETGKDLLGLVNKQVNGNVGNVDINFNLE